MYMYLQWMFGVGFKFSWLFCLSEAQAFFNYLRSLVLLQLVQPTTRLDHLATVTPNMRLVLHSITRKVAWWIGTILFESSLFFPCTPLMFELFPLISRKQAVYLIGCKVASWTTVLFDQEAGWRSRTAPCYFHSRSLESITRYWRWWLDYVFRPKISWEQDNVSAIEPSSGVWMAI